MRSTTRFIAACWLAGASLAAGRGRAGATPAGLGGVPRLPPLRRGRAVGPDGHARRREAVRPPGLRRGRRPLLRPVLHGLPRRRLRRLPRAGAARGTAAGERRLHPLPQGLLRRLGLPRPRAPRGPRALPAGPRGRRRAVPEDAPRRARRARDDLRRLPHHALAPGGQAGREDLPGVPPRRVARRARARVPRPPREDGVRGLPRGLGPAGVRDVPRPRDDTGAGGELLAAARLGPVAEERLPQEPGRAAAGARTRGARSLPSARSSSCSPPTRAGAGRTGSSPRSGRPSRPTPSGAGR